MTPLMIAERAVLANRLPFSNLDAHRAADEWGFNCGPAALAVIFDLKPDEVRPHLVEFKGFMNPTHMYGALRSLKAEWRTMDPSGGGFLPSPWGKLEALGFRFPRFGIARIQWGGPWMQPRVPIPARYRRTHWVAASQKRGQKTQIYDVNAHAWWPLSSWSRELVPKILEDVPRSDGTWFLTHSIEVTR